MTGAGNRARYFKLYTMFVKLYNYTGRGDAVNKKLGDPVILRGTWETGGNVLSPSLKVRTVDLFRFNYAQIPDVGRFYFIDHFDQLDAVTVRIYLNIDVLMTYRAAILEAYGDKVMSENGNKFLSNVTPVYDVRPHIDRINFDGEAAFNRKGNIIMVTIKGR